MMRKYKPFYNIGPGSVIKEELEARNWRQEDLAAIIGMSLKSINQLIKNKQAITKELVSHKIPDEYWVENRLRKL